MPVAQSARDIADPHMRLELGFEVTAGGSRDHGTVPRAAAVGAGCA